MLTAILAMSKILLNKYAITITVLICLLAVPSIISYANVGVTQVITARAYQISQSFEIATPTGTAQVTAARNRELDSLTHIEIDLFQDGKLTLPSSLKNCIPSPVLESIKIEMDQWPEDENQLDDHFKHIILEFGDTRGTDKWWRYSKNGNPSIRFNYVSTVLKDITIFNGKGGFREVSGPIDSCPTALIDWALAVPDAPPTDE